MHSSQSTQLLNEIKATLGEYLDAVPRQREPNPPDLLVLYARLDALNERLDTSMPASLRHYMHGKSYRKAWNFLQGIENLPGSCGH